VWRISLQTGGIAIAAIRGLLRAAGFDPRPCRFAEAGGRSGARLGAARACQQCQEVWCIVGAGGPSVGQVVTSPATGRRQRRSQMGRDRWAIGRRAGCTGGRQHSDRAKSEASRCGNVKLAFLANGVQCDIMLPPDQFRLPPPALFRFRIGHRHRHRALALRQMPPVDIHRPGDKPVQNALSASLPFRPSAVTNG
jgi:hypothetical protein